VNGRNTQRRTELAPPVTPHRANPHVLAWQESRQLQRAGYRERKASNGRRNAGPAGSPRAWRGPRWQAWWFVAVPVDGVPGGRRLSDLLRSRGSARRALKRFASEHPAARVVELRMEPGSWAGS